MTVKLGLIGAVAAFLMACGGAIDAAPDGQPQPQPPAPASGIQATPERTVAPSEVTAASPTPTATAAVSEPREPIVMPLRDITFGVDELTARRGQPLNLTLINEGLLEHDITIERIDVEAFVDGRPLGADPGDHDHGDDNGADHMVEADLHVPVSPGRTVALALIVATPGVYDFYCAVLGHREAGMVGTLVVSE